MAIENLDVCIKCLVALKSLISTSDSEMYVMAK